MKKIILALDDFENLEDAISLVKEVGPLMYSVKIHNLYDRYGREVVRSLKEAGADKVWVDFKLYDIPNTSRLRAQDISADIISVHASGGVEMMREAVKSGKEIFAVTALTSLSPEEISKIYNRNIKEQVMLLAELAVEAGVAGIVCSPQEITMLRANPKLANIKIIVPGVRSLEGNKDDQKRTSTPLEALRAGADFIVIGRQITKAENPKQEAQKIYEEIRQYM